MMNQYICTLSRRGTPIQVWPDSGAMALLTLFLGWFRRVISKP